MPRLFSRARYRVRQFLRGLRPALSADEIVEARRWLSAAEFALFLRAEPRDRRHSVDLYRLLADEGIKGAPPSREVLAAALVHDVGKGALVVWDRVAFVLLDAASPRLVEWLAREDGARWRRALSRLRHHARLGATMLERAGSSPRVVEIVRSHTGPLRGDAEIDAFIRADDRV